MEFKLVTLNDDSIFDLAELKRIDNSEFLGEDISFEQAFEFIKSYLLDGCDCILGFRDKNPVGYVIGFKNWNHYWTQKLFVLKEFRRLGIGTRLKKFQIEIAQQKGCTNISSSLLEDNIGSKRIQEKLGSHLDIDKSGVIIATLEISNTPLKFLQNS